MFGSCEYSRHEMFICLVHSGQKLTGDSSTPVTGTNKCNRMVCFSSYKGYEEVCPPAAAAPPPPPPGPGDAHKSALAAKLAALTHKAHNFQASRISSAAGSRRGSVSEEPPASAASAAPPALCSASSGVSSGGSSGGGSGDEAPPPPPPPPAPPAPPPAVLEEPALRPSELRNRLVECYERPRRRRDFHSPLTRRVLQRGDAVRLRAPAGKTLSAPAPARSLSLQCLPSAADFRSAKTDLIEELKMSRDITGIRKLRVERARRESLQDHETFAEFTKRFTADNFVDQVPERDAAGNLIPAWKRQMLARRAAERARRDLERELAGEAERRRAAAVPAWKRQLLQRREDAENRLRESLYTPRVSEREGGEWRAFPAPAAGQRALSIDNITLCYDTPAPAPAPAHPPRAPSEAKLCTDHYNGHSMTNGKHAEEEDSAKIIPWRAQLRKTNSKLNLLE
ncbi:hypothetical protein RR46_00979 [Papilio xuthus]|uniref:Espin n=1 Tax=Papilio xuthus TaxID=66420 RepID=A0A0N0P9W4_PAPXU|nr:hypothetical protein RR46_00979 [Papilio xuthus]